MRFRTAAFVLVMASGTLLAQQAAPGSAQAAKKAQAVAGDASAAKPVDKASDLMQKSKAGKRDPFVSPIVNKVNKTICGGTGKKCLVPEEVTLRGVVRSGQEMIAVVVNSADKAYFLREKDPVYNGVVVKITHDSIVFRETVSDKLGKLSSREVVKRVIAPVV